ncbi:MAG: T9SS type A sorting domain-containing protein [Candidatus Eisenbacteria bacterium]|nr:T9SS type A sorting domain-containing protein [Candidatus Eisenbacteria bacterium]
MRHTLVVASVVGAICWGSTSLAATYTVDPMGTYPTIQSAVDAASTGDDVVVPAGTFVEQVVVDGKNLTITGAGVGVSTLQSPVSLTESFETPGPNPNYPILYVHDTDDVVIQGFTIDGAGNGNGNYRFVGVGFYRAGGAVLDCYITGIQETPFTGNQHGNGIYTWNPSGNTLSIEVGNVEVDTFQKNGITINGPDINANVHDCTANGVGPTSITAQNGIQIGEGVTATVNDCAINGITYTGGTWTATGFLAFGPTDATGIALDACQTSVYYIDAGGTFENSTITNPVGDGFYAYSSSSALLASSNTRPQAQPMDDQSSDPTPETAVMDVTVRGCTATGTGLTDSWGISAYGDGGTITFNVENCFINNWDYGVVTYDFSTTSIDAHIFENDLSGNTFSVGTNLATIQDASGNWHGSADAGTVGAGVDLNVDYSPWLESGIDQDLGTAGFQGDFSVLSVDDDSPESDPAGRISQAVALVSGSTVNIAPGTYEEQVHITTPDLVLQGSGVDVSVIQSPVALTDFFSSGGADFRPIVFVDGVPGVSISDLTVDGLGRGNANNRFSGVGFWNCGGALEDCRFTNVQDTPFSGVQHGYGVVARNGDGGPHTLSITNCTADGFQKNGFDLRGAGLDFSLVGCSATGAGPTATIAQNGYVVGFGGAGSVMNCDAAAIEYTPSGTVSTGVLPFDAGGDVDINGWTTTDVQASVYYYNAGGSVSNFAISGGSYDGINFWNETTSAPFTDRARASVDTEGYVGGSPLAGPLVASVSGGCLTGTGAAGFYGIWANSTGGQSLNVSVANTSVTNFDYGLVAEGTATLTANDCSITGNLTAGYLNVNGVAQDATDNWWGDVSGPSGDGAGSGDAVSGGGVDFTPFLATGISSTSCTFTPSGGTNEVTPVNTSGDCINASSPCLTVDVNINRVESSNMRGFSVDIQLMDLDLCSTPGASILQGTYLSSGTTGSTIYQVLDNGGGSYTVDCAILGTPCGQTAATGTLFTVDVTTSGTDGTGTIQVTDVTFRDCSNVPIAGSPGAALSIDIDTSGPAPVADLLSAQVKTGNDGDGTTKVDVSFTPPMDAVNSVVYRAPYVDGGNMNAYPEYDDAPGGAPPAAPGVYPPAAPWVATMLPMGGGMDEATTRGYWYYVVYTQDACGNWSAASPMTDGVLNYHLGDVTNLGDGDNLVGTDDVSLLGFHYGASVPTGDPFNYLDVGPTSDFSVDGLPATDDLLQFEDLIMFAINFGVVSLTEPQENSIALAPKGGAVPSLVLHPAAVRADGILQANLVLSQSDVVQGVHARIDYDPAEMELVSVQPGDLVTGQGAFFGTIESDGSVAIDGAALGTGNTFHGSGLYATVTFRQTNRGATPALAEVMLRDTANRNLLAPEVDTRTGSDAAHNGAANEQPSLDARTEPLATTLLGATPNPFRGSTAIRFQLAEQTDVRVDVYSISGRLVRSLYSGSMAAGSQEVTWDGRTSVGARAESGVYLYRLQTGSKIWTAKLVLDRR